MTKNIKVGRVVFGPDETTIPSIRTNLFESTTQVMRSVAFSYAQTVAQNFAKIFGGQKIFDNPKPTDDLKKLFSYLSDPGDLIVDFFGGSGTTAQAVLELNLTDSDERKFVLVQIPEIINEKSVAYTEGFRKISEITIERVKRVIEGYGDDPQPMPNVGFKVYKLQKSNFPRCEFKPEATSDEAENVAALRRYIEEKEASFFMTLDEDSEQAVFDEVLLKNGFQLNYARIRREDFPENTIFEISDSRRSAFVCLAWFENIKDSTIKRLREIADASDRPFFICLERSLSTTSKWNLKHFLGDHFNAF